MKKMAKGGPTGMDRMKFGKNVSRMMNQEGKKMAAGGRVKFSTASVANTDSVPTKAPSYGTGRAKMRGTGAATKGLTFENDID